MSGSSNAVVKFFNQSDKSDKPAESSDAELAQDFRCILTSLLDQHDLDKSSDMAALPFQTPIQAALSTVLQLDDSQIISEEHIRAQYMLKPEHVDAMIGVLDELKMQQSEAISPNATNDIKPSGNDAKPPFK